MAKVGFFGLERGSQLVATDRWIDADGKLMQFIDSIMENSHVFFWRQHPQNTLKLLCGHVTDRFFFLKIIVEKPLYS